MSDEGPLTPGNRNLAKRHDWSALMYEWARGQETLEAFRRRHRLATAHFSRVVKKMNWRVLREQLRAEAIEKAQPRIVADIARRYSFQEKQWLTVEGIIARALKKIATADNLSLSPELLESLTRSLERTLKARKLIVNEPTGDQSNTNPNAPGTMTHSQVVELIQAINNKDPNWVIPEAVLDAEVVRDEAEKGPEIEPESE